MAVDSYTDRKKAAAKQAAVHEEQLGKMQQQWEEQREQVQQQHLTDMQTLRPNLKPDRCGVKKCISFVQNLNASQP